MERKKSSRITKYAISDGRKHKHLLALLVMCISPRAAAAYLRMRLGDVHGVTQ